MERGDLLISGLAHPVSEETDHSSLTERVRRAEKVLRSVGRTTEGETTESGTAAARPSGPADERPSLFVSFLVVTRPSKAVSAQMQSERTQAERPADPSGRSHQVAQFKLNKQTRRTSAERHRLSGRADEESAVPNTSGRAVRRASARVASKTPGGANSCTRNSFVVRMAVGIAVIFGLAGLVLLCQSHSCRRVRRCWRLFAAWFPELVGGVSWCPPLGPTLCPRRSAGVSSKLGGEQELGITRPDTRGWSTKSGREKWGHTVPQGTEQPARGIARSDAGCPHSALVTKTQSQTHAPQESVHVCLTCSTANDTQAAHAPAQPHVTPTWCHSLTHSRCFMCHSATRHKRAP